MYACMYVYIYIFMYVCMCVCICIPAAPRAPVRSKALFFVFSSRTRVRALVRAGGSEASARSAPCHTYAYEAIRVYETTCIWRMRALVSSSCCSHIARRFSPRDVRRLFEFASNGSSCVSASRVLGTSPSRSSAFALA